jgi:two-component system chemotaxis response regulator CheB
VALPAEPDLVVIGCSWGGLAALTQVLEGLPSKVTAPVVVVQHRGTGGSALAELLARQTDRPVKEADDKQELVAGAVYVAPPQYHLLVEPGRLALSTDEPVRFSRPSIDVTFESAADAYPNGVVGIVLTGANADGARGLAHIVRRGGRAIVQDPATAERREMPDAAIAAVPSAIVAAADRIGSLLCPDLADADGAR